MKMNRLLVCCFVPAALITLLSAPSRSRQSDDGNAAASELVTLFAHDDISSSFSFRTGRPSARVTGGEIDLASTHLAFHVFAERMISFGFARDENVNIIDLGPEYVTPHSRSQDAAPKFPISIFHSLFLDGSQFSYIGPGETLQRHRDAERIFGALPGRGLYHVEPIVGNTHLLRAEQRGVRGVETLAKFQVVDLIPDRSLTIRWERIPMR